MASELWLRNPGNYVREMKEVGHSNFIFDYGWVVKRKMDPVQWAKLQFGETYPYRMMVCGDQGTAEYRPGSDLPVAVYPTWQYGDDEGTLESFLKYNLGDDPSMCGLDGIPPEENTVLGQEHRVVVMNFPDVQYGSGRQFMNFLRELQMDYPKAILHVHGLATFSLPCRLEFQAFDWDPRTPAGMGVIYLPTGKQVHAKQSKEPYRDWITLMGSKPVELDVPRNRCMYNIRSARWAADNFTKDSRIVFKNDRVVDMTLPKNQYNPRENMRIMFKNRIKPKPGDKFICNSCSLVMACKYYREGSVCTVPSSESKELAEFFQTRDTDAIMDGLGRIMRINAERLERGVEAEEDGKVKGGIDKNVTAIAGQLFDQAVKLAKLADPSLRNPKLQVNIGGTTNVVQLQDPRQFIATATKAFLEQGFTIDQITPEMMENALRGSGARIVGDPEHEPALPRTIEAPVVSVTDVVDLSELPF